VGSRRESLVQALQQEIDEAEAPLPEQRQELQQQLERRRQLEQQESYRRTDAERSRVEATQQERQAALQQVQLDARELEVRCDTLAAQLDEQGESVQQIDRELEAEAEPEQRRRQLDRLHRRIEQLGPANMAAIDELAREQERRDHLESQRADLQRSLESLQQANRRIDRESRARLRATFEQLNAHLGELFPRLFGGGHARLVATGDDLLEAGIVMVARPPGKRNASIHLLSGGEKTLAALALLFSLFRLNPACLCLMDEVDAPLDDANVSRFIELVRQMSEEVQFIFITHNKLTMELAESLIGVTMQEAGVSRLVAVDVAEAIDLAATA